MGPNLSLPKLFELKIFVIIFCPKWKIYLTDLNSIGYAKDPVDSDQMVLPELGRAQWFTPAGTIYHDLELAEKIIQGVDVLLTMRNWNERQITVLINRVLLEWINLNHSTLRPN